MYHCETERPQSLLRAAGAPSRACSFVPQVAQACQVCRPWKRPGQPNTLTLPLALPPNDEVQFHLMFYRSALERGVGRGERHNNNQFNIDCCTRWSACIRAPCERARDLSDCITTSWVNSPGGMKTLTLDGGTGMKGKEAYGWAMCSQMNVRHEVPHQKA